MNCYHYHPETKEFLGTSLADKSPLEVAVYLIPAHSTTMPPPNTRINEVAIYDNEEWVVIDDLRGTDYWDQDGTKHTVTEIGEILPINSIVTPRPGVFYTTHDGSNWILDIESAKIYLCDTVIQQEKSRVKNGGFYVNGIFFDSDDTAQIALTQFALKLNSDQSYVVDNWKASTGSWVTMDAVLFNQVMSEWERHCKACFDWQEAKEVEISACATAAEIEAVFLVFEE